VPAQAISLALAASIYPPAVAAVIALGRGTDVRLRVFLMVCAAVLTVFATGALMLLLFEDLGASGNQHRTPSAGVEIAIGAVLLGLAYRLSRPRPESPQGEEAGESKTARYLESRRLVLVLGFVLYVLPSPIYIGAVKAISDSGGSTSTQLAYLAVVVAVMLWMIEVPMFMLIAFPARSAAALESVNAWFARNGRTLAVLVAAGAGLYLIGTGVVKLSG
jgi:hypothetical protein